MLEIIQKYLNVIVNIIFWLSILPLLFVLSFVNIENIYQFNFTDFYTIIYFLYFFVWIVLLFIFKYFNISNSVIKEELFYTIKSIVFISILLIPSFFINHFFIVEHLWSSNLYLRSYWRIAFLYFALALSISPILSFIINIIIIVSIILWN